MVQNMMQINLYFSPNGDGNYDSVKLKAVLLRNVDNIHVTVYKKR